MKAAAQPLAAQAGVAEKGSLAIYAELFKARLTFLVLLTTLVGFYVGSSSRLDYILMFNALAGTALVASGASALNQLWERQHDAKMRRTADRPLPSGRLQPQTVLAIGCITAAIGLLHLGLAVNLTTGILGACSLLSYIFIYTPLKRVTWLNTAIGAIPGGLPPLMGWAAARGELGAGGWTLFAIQALWQMPHFMAIAWMYRDDYAKAGFKMLPVIDSDGRRTGRHAVLETAALLPVSLLPFFLNLAGAGYALGAAILSSCFFWFALRFARSLTLPRARQLFYVSILYLPLLLALMMADRIR
jgi:heme o synthase